jgi:hypothetical protein
MRALALCVYVEYINIDITPCTFYPFHPTKYRTQTHTHTHSPPLQATKYAIHTNNIGELPTLSRFPLFFFIPFSMWNGRTSRKLKTPYAVQFYWANCVRWFYILYIEYCIFFEYIPYMAESLYTIHNIYAIVHYVYMHTIRSVKRYRKKSKSVAK